MWCFLDGGSPLHCVSRACNISFIVICSMSRPTSPMSSDNTAMLGLCSTDTAVDLQ